ncbi:MAG: hypothetical protein KJO79_00655, partial [Verrucomicrobiae bacterium]|nr:hypothetical protein [Verrucomicrobiae bacterium]NNJ85653.1 hypothetical protein [Akkermansiaceae bacterium]
MPSNHIPAIPDPDASPNKAPQHPPKEDQPERSGQPIRLEPVLDSADKKTGSGDQDDSASPADSSTGYPTQLEPPQDELIPDDADQDDRGPITKPITSEENWHRDKHRPGSTSSPLVKLITIALSLTAMGLIIFLIWKMGNDPVEEQPIAKTFVTTDQTPDIPWEANAREVLARYLNAEAHGEIKEQLDLVTKSEETKVLLPKFQPKFNRFDVVEASSFVAKPLPDSFTNMGIYLMYYQRPDTLPEDAVFRPIVPMRVKLT